MGKKCACVSLRSYRQSTGTDLKIVIVTGGVGFIGSAFIRHLISHSDYRVVNYDKLTYTGNLESLLSASKSHRYHFARGDICDHREVEPVHRVSAIMHFTAESHVDRYIDDPADSINTNIFGTNVLLEVARHYLGVSRRPRYFPFLPSIDR